MLLALDVGNTNITIVTFRCETLTIRPYTADIRNASGDLPPYHSHTNFTIGAFLGETQTGRWRLRTIREQTADESGIRFRNISSDLLLDDSQTNITIGAFLGETLTGHRRLRNIFGHPHLHDDHGSRHTILAGEVHACS